MQLLVVLIATVMLEQKETNIALKSAAVQHVTQALGYITTSTSNVVVITALTNTVNKL